MILSLYDYENILYFNEVSGNVVFSRNEMVILNLDLSNINLVDTKMVLILLFLSDFWRVVLNLKKKHLKKDNWRINACMVAS